MSRSGLHKRIRLLKIAIPADEQSRADGGGEQE
jgi:hypothetical protein